MPTGLGFIYSHTYKYYVVQKFILMLCIGLFTSLYDLGMTVYSSCIYFPLCFFNLKGTSLLSNKSKVMVGCPVCRMFCLISIFRISSLIRVVSVYINKLFHAMRLILKVEQGISQGI